MQELIFEVTQDGDGGFVAECLTEAIVTQADSWEALRDEVHDAVRGHFFDGDMPARIRLHLLRDEVMATA